MWIKLGLRNLCKYTLYYYFKVYDECVYHPVKKVEIYLDKKLSFDFGVEDVDSFVVGTRHFIFGSKKMNFLFSFTM